MPQVTKEALSQFIRTECKRQLRLYLSPDNARFRPERTAQNMPDPQPPRPGLEHIAQAGDEWEALKLHDLTDAFGAAAVVGDPYVHSSGQTRYRPVTLISALTRVTAGQFMAQPEFEVGATLEAAIGITPYRGTYNLEYARARPDIVQVCPPRFFARRVLPSGDLETLAQGDERLQLRIIDIKLTAEPSPSYFAEVAYYTLLLAGWLVDQGLDQRFVVVPDGAVWPGSHDAAQLTVKFHELASSGVTPTSDQLLPALEADLEPVPFEVFAYRVRRFFQFDLPEVLGQPWDALEWHVDNRCKSCEYLGYQWPDPTSARAPHPNHCMPMALRQNDLSRVADVTRGAKSSLRGAGIADVPALALRSANDPAFDTHHQLRATRSVVATRAASLQTGQTSLAPQSGTSAVMPRWADLRIYVSADFDLSSAITFAFGLQAFWLEPRPFGSASAAQRRHQVWQARAFIVDQKDLTVERRELLAFLDAIHNILSTASRLDQSTTVQLYLWDSLQYEHLARVIGRHLPFILANSNIQYLAWLFPPEEILPNPTLSTRRSPLTHVRTVVRGALAAPIPHYYSLLETARLYHSPNLPPNVAQFSVHPLFEDPLSDQIPSERAHEIWSRATTPRHWQDSLRTMVETVQRRLRALETITQRLESDLGAALGQTAPRITIGPPTQQSRLSADGQLWYAYAKLDAALAELEVHQTRAMPVHEREARFHSARLIRRLVGPDEQVALTRLGVPGAPGRRLYELQPASQEVKAREGDFDRALAPEGDARFLDRAAAVLTSGTPLQSLPGLNPSWRGEDLTSVSIVALDRDAGLLAIDPDRSRPATILDDLETNGIVNLTTDVVLDPVYRDFFTARLLAALQAIGNPPSANADPLVRRAIGLAPGRGARRSGHTPPADLLWSADRMHAFPVVRSLPSVRTALEQNGIRLNPTQWQAWEEALSHRLQLVWGPPGTGKSRTATAIVLGAALDAYQQHQAVRILICTSTYTALDNVLLPANQQLHALVPPTTDLIVRRLRSAARPMSPAVPIDVDLEVNRSNPSQDVLDLRTRLQGADGITIVGATPEQIHNLLTTNHDPAQQEWFDLILIDEASQMDVAHAILPLCSLASGGSVVLAGDPKQLSPIHTAEPPVGLEAMVGSIYTFCQTIHHVPEIMLDMNYRSNDTLVAFAREAGYQGTLHSASPNLQLDLTVPIPRVQPPGWPPSLHWTSEWAELLDPAYPAVCFVYSDGRSSQWNPFEAEAVTALVALLGTRLASQLLNEQDPATGNIRPRTGTPYSIDDFWDRGVGIVTPHRAQQGLIIGRLQQVFVPTGVTPQRIRDAVDTVERFQGQERDVIIASFALGDPDAIESEDEFLLSLNRFNVMASRARAKLIMLISQQVVDHLSNDAQTLRESRLLKTYVESFCRNSRPMTLGFGTAQASVAVPGLFRYR